MSIPVVDLSQVNLSKEFNELDEVQVKEVAALVKEALLEWGFVYLNKHGIPMEQVENAFKSSKEFFEKPLDVKEKYHRPPASTKIISGYTGIGREAFEAESVNAADIKECLDYAVESNVILPTEVPRLKSDVETLYRSMGNLASRILYLFGIALELDDPLYFVNSHSNINIGNTGTSFRSLYYPPLKNKEVMTPGQLRCSEHTDYGSMTLLFQDELGGLLVKRRDGSFVPATPVKDAVLLNIADLLQRWTNDEFVAVRHKVVIPEEERRQSKPRQSMVLFVHPNKDTVVKGIRGVEKYPSINAHDYLWANFSSTYRDN